jgi:hypothetical protein
LVAAKLKESQIGQKLEEREGWLQLAQSGLQPQNLKDAEKVLFEIQAKIEKRKTGMKIAPKMATQLQKEITELSKEEAIAQKHVRELKHSTSEESLLTEVPATKTELAAAKKTVADLEAKLARVSKLPVLPPGPGGMKVVSDSDDSDVTFDVKKVTASDATATKLIEAGDAVEKDADKVVNALGDLAEGKGELAKAELREAKDNKAHDSQSLKAVQSKAEEFNPATVMSLEANTAKYVAEGIPKHIAELKAQQDLTIRDLTKAQKELEVASNKAIQAQEVNDVTGAFSTHERFLERKKKKTAKIEREIEAKEQKEKAEEEEATRAAAAALKEKQQKEAEKDSKESASKAAIKRKKLQEKAEQERAEKKQEQVEEKGPFAAQVHEQTEKSRVKVDQVKADERKLKLKSVMDGMKVYNHSPKKREVYEKKYEVLKQQLSATELELAVAQKKQTDAAREIRVAREKSEKKAAAAALRAKAEAEALAKEIEADELANKQSQKETEQAEAALQAQIAATAQMADGEAKTKAELKMRQAHEKMAQLQREAQARAQKMAITQERSTKVAERVKAQKESEQKIVERNKREQKEQAGKVEAHRKAEVIRAAQIAKKKAYLKRAREEALQAAKEAQAKATIGKEHKYKHKFLHEISHEGKEAYTELTHRYDDKIKAATDHEASEKYKINAPFIKEKAHKKELSHKKLAKAKAAQKEKDGKKRAAKRARIEANRKRAAAEKADKTAQKLAESNAKKAEKEKRVESAEKTVERSKKKKEKAEKSKDAAAREDAQKKAQEATDKAKAAKVAEAKEKAKAAAIKAEAEAEHQAMLKKASGFPKTRLEPLRFKRLGQGVKVVPMRPSSRVRVIKVGDVCMVEGVVQTPIKQETTQPVLGYLPQSCWPNRRLVFNQAKIEEEVATSIARVDVLVTGQIIAVTNSDPGAKISMDGMVFSPQGSAPMTASQVRLCQGWKAPGPAPLGPPPEPPIGQLSWMSKGCWLDGGTGVQERRELGEPDVDIGEDMERRRRRRRRERRTKRRQKKRKERSDKAEEKAEGKARLAKIAEKAKADEQNAKEVAKAAAAKAKAQAEERADKKAKERADKKENAVKLAEEKVAKAKAARVAKEKAAKAKEKSQKEAKVKAKEKAAKEKRTKRREQKPIFSPANILGYENKNFAKKKDAIRSCAAFAARKNLPMFSVAQGGYCYVQTTPNQNYMKFGTSKMCKQGAGSREANDVYEVMSQEQEDPPPKTSKWETDVIGCFARTTKSRKARLRKLKDKGKKKSTAFKLCEAYARRKKYEYFGVSDGKCFTQKDFSSQYRQEKESTKCKNGIGATDAYSVYRVQSRAPYDSSMPGAQNVALGRPTEMSPVAQQSPSWFAVDGNTTKCAHTQPVMDKTNNFLRIQLLERTNVQAVEVFAGADSIKSFAVHVTDSTFWKNSPSCGISHSVDKKSSKTVNCELQGKFVYIINLHMTPLDICEVRVWAHGKPKDKKAVVAAPPAPPQPQEFGARRRALATSFRPKGKKMLHVHKLALKNKWTDFGNGYGSAFVKEQGSLCFVSGMVSGPAMGVVAELPPSCRPKKTLVFALNNHESQSRFNVDPSGEISWGGGADDYKWASLNGISFSTGLYHRQIRLKNEWMAFDEKNYPTANYVVENRICVLGGLVFAGKFDVVGVLHPECRPQGTKVFNVATGADLDKIARINIFADGRILWTGGQQDEAFLSLNGIVFPTRAFKQHELIEYTMEEELLQLEQL